MCFIKKAHFKLNPLTFENFQIITPFFLVMGPVLAYIIVVLTGHQSKRYISQFGYFLLTLYGGTNSISTLLFVGPYRKYTFENVIQPWLIPTLTFLRKHKMLPQSIVIGAYYNWGNQVGPASTSAHGLSVATD